MQPLVSIGLPVYNGESYLREALDSLLAQDYQNFELIISDNGSTDATSAICQEYALRDERISYYRSEQNQGASWNFNHVLQLSKGEFFMWAAHDDVWRQDFIEKCLQELLKEPQAVLCYCHCQFISPNSDLLNISFAGDPRKEDSIYERWLNLHKYWEIHASVYGLMRREAISLVRQALSIHCSDLVFVSEMITQGKILVIPEILHYKRLDFSRIQYKNKKEMISFLGGKTKKTPHMIRWKATLECIRGLKQKNLSGKVYNRLAFDAIFNYLTSHIKTDLTDELREIRGKSQ